jgi:hypothetical protein
MKYLKLYESFMPIKAITNKKLILFSGPSGSGKSYLAEKLGAKHWYEGDTSVALIGTDNFGHDYKKTFSKLSKLLKEFGCPELSKFKKDWHWLIELGSFDYDGIDIVSTYKDDYKKWHESASDEEKKKYEELKRKLPFEKSQEKGKNFPRRQKDGRICGMAWTAYLLPESTNTIIFDDISTGIKNYFKVRDILVFTPLDWMMKNIKSRFPSIKAREIEVNEEGTSLYQYCDWFMATDKPDLDNKMYTSENLISLLTEVGHNNPKEILKKLGVDAELENGFYLTTRPKVNPDMIVNTRDKSTGRAIGIDSLSI